MISLESEEGKPARERFEASSWGCVPRACSCMHRFSCGTSSESRVATWRAHIIPVRLFGVFPAITTLFCVLFLFFSMPPLRPSPAGVCTVASAVTVRQLRAFSSVTPRAAVNRNGAAFQGKYHSEGELRTGDPFFSFNEHSASSSWGRRSDGGALAKSTKKASASALSARRTYTVNVHSGGVFRYIRPLSFVCSRFVESSASPRGDTQATVDRRAWDVFPSSSEASSSSISSQATYRRRNHGASATSGSSLSSPSPRRLPGNGVAAFLSSSIPSVLSSSSLFSRSAQKAPKERQLHSAGSGSSPREIFGGCSQLRHLSSVSRARGAPDTANSFGEDEDPAGSRHPVFTSTKQIATIGPASWDYEEIERLFLAGVDVFRLNMSHGLLSEKHQQLLHVRRLEKAYKQPVAVLADLPGPKFRLGIFRDDEAFLAAGAAFTLDSSAVPGDASRVHLPHPEILSVLRPGDIVLMDDGKIKLRVVAAAGASDGGEAAAVQCEVLVGGRISSKKGVNVPSALLPVSALSARDRELARTVASWGVDWIALSFVQSAADVHELRRELLEAARESAAEPSPPESPEEGVVLGSRAGRVRPDISVIVKIEKPVALENFAEILAAADGIMVARGDLGVELPSIAWLPRVQKRLVSLCRKAGKPAVVATQMLESMTQAPLPTRAEVSDVANAVYDGADAVMLSGETAAGKFPAHVARMQRLGIEAVEDDPEFWAAEDARRRTASPRSARNSRAPAADEACEKDRMATILARFLPSRRGEPRALGSPAAPPEAASPVWEEAAGAWMEAAAEMARGSGAKAILVLGESEEALRRLAALRPPVPVVAVTPCAHAARRLKMYWGIYPVFSSATDAQRDCAVPRSQSEMHAQLQLACSVAKQERFVEAGTDSIVVVTRPETAADSGVSGEPPAAPLLTVCRLDERALSSSRADA
ncbi:hypothetical protein BESB_011780 [Besnoitia besnoiti]|uniref:Pyruvate kinase n=1 Tax=Besnoitia besnoiti TaxID=94643 RepID=A0A2A9M9I0_BESBE|nr:hypothetical protein BESB_011780 [Besnoitia besnoiti]PFH32566.1 hypothetical protein BESB_011780 [Besnoitia besnoiti]